jgi:hypothetical protein
MAGHWFDPYGPRGFPAYILLLKRAHASRPQPGPHPTLIAHQRRSSILLAFALGLTAACGGDGIVLPDESRPAAIVIVSGNGQSASAGSALDLPLVVKVNDGLGRPIGGQAVAFTVESGGGQVTPASVSTGEDGEVAASWTLGSAAGQQLVKAQVSGNDLQVQFTASANTGEGALLELVSGDNQTAAVGSALPDSLVVRVTDALGNPVSGVEVQWAVAGGGSISPASVLSGADGKAAAERVLGNASGTQTATATAAGIAPVAFTQTAEPANPTTLAQISGNGQIGAAGAPLADSLVVRLLDDNGNGIGGKAVTWVIGSGGGSVSPTTVITNPNGFAATQWTLGPNAVSNSLNAVYSGVPPVPFTASTPANTSLSITGFTPNKPAIGEAVTVEWTLGVTGGGSGTPTGTVTVSGNGTTGCSAPAALGTSSCTLTFTASGATTILVAYAGDAHFLGSSDSETHTVMATNVAPSAVADAYGLIEDATLTVPAGSGVLANDSDPDGDSFTAVLDAGPTHAQSFTLNADGSFTYVPVADYNGGDSFTYHADDGPANSGTVTVTLTVAAVNDAPSFVSGGDVTVNAADGAHTQAWATGATGPANEASQGLAYTATVDFFDGFLFASPPSIDPDGTLHFTPSGFTGTATVTVHVSDDGGTANSGVDTSPNQTFTITIN